MRYKITHEARRILNELARLAEGLQEHLSSVSAEARREWEELRLRWPSEQEVSRGTVVLTYDELAIMESKVRRFHDILTVRSSPPPGSRTSHSAKEIPQASRAREPLRGPRNAGAAADDTASSGAEGAATGHPRRTASPAATGKAG